MTDKLLMGEGEMLRRLSSHPERRNRIVSLLSAVDDTGGDLKLADDAEMRLTQELGNFLHGLDLGTHHAITSDATNHESETRSADNADGRWRFDTKWLFQLTSC